MDLVELSQQILDEIQQTLRPVDVEEEFSKHLFRKYGHVILCGRWLCDDHAWLLKRNFEKEYTEMLHEYVKGLMENGELAKVGFAFYWIKDLKELVQYGNCI